MFRFHDRLKQAEREHELVAECEAFLSGHFAQHLFEEHLPVPGWAWMNAVAHGGIEDIARIASGHAPGVGLWSDASRPWQQALAFLAREVMSLVDAGAYTLEEIQQSSLVPIELHMAGTDPWPWTPRSVVRRVLDDVDRLRAQHGGE